jgi:crotonobetainyl-CoA:carnitine CoA-transferase CaiB-like acyl-CoA transferase
MYRGGKPMWSFSSFGDTGNGFLSAIGIMQALYRRRKTGESQWVDTSIVNAQLLAVSCAVARPDGSGFDRPLLDGMQLGTSATHRLYETAAGWLCLVVATEPQWQALAAALDLSGDPRFATPEARARNDGALWTLLEERFRRRDARSWVAALDAAGVPVEICDADFAMGLHEDADMKRRRWVTSYPQHYVGRVDQIGLLFDLSDTPGTIQGPPLVVGERTEEILRELGYSDGEIAALAAERAIMTWSPDKDPGGMPQNPWANKK